METWVVIKTQTLQVFQLGVLQLMMDDRTIDGKYRSKRGWPTCFVRVIPLLIVTGYWLFGCLFSVLMLFLRDNPVSGRED